MSNSGKIAEIIKKYNGKTFMLFLESLEGITMDQIIPNAKVEIDSEETVISLNSSVISEIAQITLSFEIDFNINERDEEDIMEGSLESLSLIYPSGNELQVEIVENEWSVNKFLVLQERGGTWQHEIEINSRNCGW